MEELSHELGCRVGELLFLIWGIRWVFLLNKWKSSLVKGLLMWKRQYISKGKMLTFDLEHIIQLVN